MEKLTIKVLQRRMVAFSMLALLLTGTAVAAVAILPLADRLGDAAREDLVHIHALTSQSLGQHARTLEGLAMQVTSRTAIRKKLEAHLAGDVTAAELNAFTHPKLADAMALSSLMIGITRRGPDGATLISVGQPPPPDITLPATTPIPLLQGPHMDDGATVIVVVAPIFDDQGVLVGSDVVTFSANGLAPVLGRPGRQQSYLGRVSGEKTMWFGVSAAGRVMPAAAPVPLTARDSLDISTHNGPTGTAWVTVGGPQGETGWQLVTAAEAADVFGDVRAALILSTIATAVAVALGALGLLLLLRPLTGTLVVHADDMALQVAQLRSLSRDLEDERRRLTDSNADLEQFAYAASHDLQQPLRMISGFLDLLRRRHGDCLDDQGQEYIGYAIDGARQLRAMIQGLLEFSRVGRTDAPPSPTDLDRAVRQALDLLRLRVAETDADIRMEVLPTIMAEPQQMVRLFQNLIDNALKYRQPDRPPRVTITSEAWPGADGSPGWYIRVTDNGLGMSPDQQRNAFGLFRRLHPELNVEGTGLGLALCHKIVLHHGGTITLDSAVGDGTTFTIWLPEGGAASPPVEDLDHVAGVA